MIRRAATEIPLAGGNVSSGVVRIGDTVRRPAGPWTPAVHALLRHLRARGFPGAPVPLGLDGRGREVLRFVPGRVVWPDHFELVEPASALAAVGRLIRQLHDAAQDFVPPPDARWQALIPADGAELIVHHDLAPWNLISVGDGSLTFVDWDAAAPGTRLWDLAYAAHGFVPLSADPERRLPDQVAAARLRLLADAYGLREVERRRLPPLLGRRARSMHVFLREQAGRGVQPWARLWAAGHGDVWRDDADYADEREELWRQALGSA